MKLDLKTTLSIIFFVFLTSSVVATMEELSAESSEDSEEESSEDFREESSEESSEKPSLANYFKKLKLIRLPIFEVRNSTNLVATAGIEDLEIYNGLWGKWTIWVGPTSGALYACGAQLRFEGEGGMDNRAATGLKLKFCSLHDWHSQQTETINDGIWGHWKDMEMCPYGKYIGGAKVRFQNHQGEGGGFAGEDDTALNGLVLWCVDKNWHGGEKKLVYRGIWGDWKSWGYSTGKLVKMARVRFQDEQGFFGDDTALNGIHFRVEPPHYGVSKSEIRGVWKDVGSGPQGRFTHKIRESSRTTQHEEISQEQTHAFTQEISAGFKFLSAKVSKSQSLKMSKTIGSSLAVHKGTETTLHCPETGSPTSYYTMWQWTMTQRSDENGVGFNSKTNHIRCTPSADQPPKCVLGFCADKFCQICK